MPAGKLLLDTNVCGRLVEPAYEGVRAPLQKFIAQNYRLQISPLTIIELLRCFRNVDNNFFQVDRDRLGIAVGGATINVLPFPGVFALQRTLSIQSPIQTLRPEEFKRWIRVVLAARTAHDLYNGNVRLAGDRRRRRWGLDHKIIEQQHVELTANYVEALKHFQDGSGQLSGRNEWASRVARTLEVDLTFEQAARLGKALQVAYHYLEASSLVAKSAQYKPPKHTSDFIDYQQLFYLSDESISILTADGFGQKLTSCPSASRVVLLEDFLLKHGLGSVQAEM